MTVGGPSGQPSGSGGAVAGLVSSGSISGRTGTALRRVGVGPRAGPCGTPHRLARCVRRSDRTRVRIARAARAFASRRVRVGVLLFCGAVTAIRRVPYYVVSRTLQKTRADVKQSLVP